MNPVADLLTIFRAYLAARSDPTLKRFAEGFDWQMDARELPSRHLPVVDYLDRMRPPTDGLEATLFSALANAADMLHWAQTYNISDFGEDFLKKYGWVELFGTRGHFRSDDMAGGFLLLGPDVHYPDHHHVAEEIYIPLSDHTLWSKDGQPLLPRWSGEVIHHPSDIRHAMRTEDKPLLALYLWRGGPLAQKSIISGRQS